MVNKVFADYVRSASFNLSLSKNMIFHLHFIANESVPKRSELDADNMIDTTVSTTWRLKERGLVESPDPKSPGKVRLTKAGELVYELLKEAGFYNEEV